MFNRHWIVPRMMAMVAMVSLSAGCSSAVIHDNTALTSDSYALWSGRVDHIPFRVHFADGHVESYDDRGEAWVDAGHRARAKAGGHVEVYADGAPTPASSLCGKPAAQGPVVANDGRATVVSALCDSTRTVVSVTDDVKSDIPPAGKAYIPRVRRLLLDGVWSSDARVPEPLPQF